MGRFETIRGREPARAVGARPGQADAAALRTSDAPREGFLSALDAYYRVPDSWAAKFGLAPRLMASELAWAPSALTTTGTAIGAASYFLHGMDPAQLMKTAVAYPLLRIGLHLAADYLGPYSVHNEAGRHARAARTALYAERFAEAGAGYRRALEDLEWSRHAVEYGLMGAYAYLRLADDEVVGNRQRALALRTQAADHLRLAACRSGLREVQTDAAILHFLSMSAAGASHAARAAAYAAVPRSWPWQAQRDLETGTRRWLEHATFGSALGEAATERLMSAVMNETLAVSVRGSAARTTSESPAAEGSFVQARHILHQAREASGFWQRRRIRREAFAILNTTTDRAIQRCAAAAAVETHSGTWPRLVGHWSLAKTLKRVAALMTDREDRLWYGIYATVARHEGGWARRADIYRAARTIGRDGHAIVHAGCEWIMSEDFISPSQLYLWARRYFDSYPQVDAELASLNSGDGT